jgi:hypothetical protein
VVVNNALPPEMLATFLFTMACTLVLAAVMIAIRYRIETLIDEKQASIAGEAGLTKVFPARSAGAGPEAAR